MKENRRERTIKRLLFSKIIQYVIFIHNCIFFAVFDSLFFCPCILRENCWPSASKNRRISRHFAQTISTAGHFYARSALVISLRAAACSCILPFISVRLSRDKSRNRPDQWSLFTPLFWPAGEGDQNTYPAVPLKILVLSTRQRRRLSSGITEPSFFLMFFCYPGAWMNITYELLLVLIRWCIITMTIAENVNARYTTRAFFIFKGTAHHFLLIFFFRNKN